VARVPETLSERRGNRPKLEREVFPAIPTDFEHLVDELDAIAADAKNDPALARFLGTTLTLAKAKKIAATAKKPMAWLAVAQQRVGPPKPVRLTKFDIKVEPRHGGAWWGPTHIARGLLPVAPMAIIGDATVWSVCPTKTGPFVVTGDLEAQGITMFGELRVLGTLRIRGVNGGGTIVLGADGYTLSTKPEIIVSGTLHVGPHAKVPAMGIHPNNA
jgi:hypothetical protein